MGSFAHESVQGWARTRPSGAGVLKACHFLNRVQGIRNLEEAISLARADWEFGGANKNSAARKSCLISFGVVAYCSGSFLYLCPALNPKPPISLKPCADIRWEAVFGIVFSVELTVYYRVRGLAAATSEYSADLTRRP